VGDIFISYSRKDTEFVRNIEVTLTEHSHNVWVDWKEIRGGSEWWKEIITGIEGADKFIFVISPDSIDSEYCGKEIEYAVRQNKKILPILWRSGLGSKGIPLRSEVSSHHYISFEARDDFDQAIQELNEAINLDIDLFHAHKRLLVKAIEWNNNAKEESYLLRGKDLELAEMWLSKSGDKNPKPTESQVTYIKISRKIEDANQKAIVIRQIALVIGLIIVMLAVVGSVGVVLLIKQSTSMQIAEAVKDRMQAQEEAKQAQEEANKVKAEAIQLQKDANKVQTEAKKLQEDAKKAQDAAKKTQNEYIQLRESIKQKSQETVAESNSLLANKTESGNKNILVYIQVPSESVKNRLSYLKTEFKNKGYDAPNIEIVGESISPDTSDIRYFSQEQKELAEKLKQDLISIDPKYNDFKTKRVNGYEGKSQPLEIWFGKDTK
jgi:tetratricopeptide (TPR) repeat protein